MSNNAPYSWIRKIDQGLMQLDTIPLMRAPIDFQFEEFTKNISDQLQIENLHIELANTNWLTGDEILTGLGANLLPLAFSFAPLEGHIYWLMNEDDIAKLTSYILFNRSKKTDGFSSPFLQEGYYRYLMLESMHVLEKMEFFNELSAKEVDNIEKEEKEALCLDIKLSLDKRAVWGRLCITPTFRASWEKFFAQQFSPLKNLKKSFEVPLLVELGHTNLSKSKIDELEKGDFLLLDQSNWDPITHKGMIKISLGNEAIFLAKIKPNGLKIVDYAYYQEDNSMNEEKWDEPIEEHVEESPSEEIAEPIGPLDVAAKSIKEMDTIITVEAARFRISLEKLLSLQPGNLLELPIRPHQKVNLSVNNQIIGHGELVHLGEVLGVKITDINK